VQTVVTGLSGTGLQGPSGAAICRKTKNESKRENVETRYSLIARQQASHDKSPTSGTEEKEKTEMIGVCREVACGAGTGDVRHRLLDQGSYSNMRQRSRPVVQ
jgi:hypothetical protein